MLRLKDAHRGERALVIFGGPSLLASGFDFSWLRPSGFVTFLETKALTPGFLATGAAPDYYLMLFPEKAKDNTLQHWVYRSLLANYRIDWLLKPEHRPLARRLREQAGEHLEVWRPQKGPHKNLRFRPGIYLKDSPYDLLARIPQSRVIVHRQLQEHYFPEFAYADRAYYFGQIPHASPTFDMDLYFNPVEQDGELKVRCADTFMNSAAIALYPLLRHLGFAETYFIGMDMSILGSFEYAAPYTFRSMAHFWWFLRRNGRVFNANFKSNGWFFRRPQSEFDDLRRLWNDGPMRFTRVYSPWRYATPIDGIRTIAMAEFLRR